MTVSGVPSSTTPNSTSYFGAVNYPVKPGSRPNATPTSATTRTPSSAPQTQSNPISASMSTPGSSAPTHNSNTQSIAMSSADMVGLGMQTTSTTSNGSDWRNRDQDIEVRKQIARRVLQIIMKSSAKAPPNWRPQELARRLEHSLYHSSPSRSAYADLNTLRQRLQRILNVTRMQAQQRQAQAQQLRQRQIQLQQQMQQQRQGQQAVARARSTSNSNSILDEIEREAEQEEQIGAMGSSAMNISTTPVSMPAELQDSPLSMPMNSSISAPVSSAVMSSPVVPTSFNVGTTPISSNGSSQSFNTLASTSMLSTSPIVTSGSTSTAVGIQSSVASSSSLDPNKQQKLVLLQQRLILLKHARLCSASNCSTAHCSAFKRLLAHLSTCQIPVSSSKIAGSTGGAVPSVTSACTTAGCAMAKQLLSHYKLCRNFSCALCNSIRTPMDSNEQQTVIRRQQERLCLLRHASVCRLPNDSASAVVNGGFCRLPHCAEMKVLWRHLCQCSDRQCHVQHCVSSRYVLAHFKECRNATCQVCTPVRRAIHIHATQKRQKAAAAAAAVSSNSTSAFAATQELNSQNGGSSVSIADTFNISHQGVTPSSKAPTAPSTASPTLSKMVASSAAAKAAAVKRNTPTSSASSSLKKSKAAAVMKSANSKSPVGNAAVSKAGLYRGNVGNAKSKINIPGAPSLSSYAKAGINTSGLPASSFAKSGSASAKGKVVVQSIGKATAAGRAGATLGGSKAKANVNTTPNGAFAKDAASRLGTAGVKRTAQQMLKKPGVNKEVKEEKADGPASKKLKVAEKGSAPNKRKKEKISPSGTSANALMQKKKKKKRKLEKKSKEHSYLSFLSHEQLKEHMRSIRFGCTGFLTTALLKQYVMPSLKSLMDHKFGWVFSTPVDPVLLNIPDYFKIITCPMDLGTIKKRLDMGLYASLETFSSDVRLTFENCMAYNDEKNEFHMLARDLLQTFNKDIETVEQQIEKDLVKACEEKKEERCQLCGGESMKFAPSMLFCNGKCKGRIRRHTHYYSDRQNLYHWCATCYKDMKDNEKITVVVPQVAPSIAPGSVPSTAPAGKNVTVTLVKSDLRKQKNSEVAEEPWVECDTCKRWFHQICALFNERNNTLVGDEELFHCPECVYRQRIKEKEEEQQQQDKKKSSTELKVKEEKPNGTPAQPPVSEAASAEAKRHEIPKKKSGGLRACRIPMSRLSKRVENMVVRSLEEAMADDAVLLGLEEKHSVVKDEMVAVKDTDKQSSTVHQSSSSSTAKKDEPFDAWRVDKIGRVTVREVLSVYKNMPYKPQMSQYVAKTNPKVMEELTALSTAAAQSAKSKGKSKSKNTKNTKTKSVKSTAKSASNGSTSPSPLTIPYRSRCLCVFQEHEGVDVLLFTLYIQEYDENVMKSNQRKLYISYLDSVHFFRPKKFRTLMHQQVLIGVLEDAKLRGFHMAHIWSCPPLKGDDYIFFCKPENQKIPKAVRLRSWYIKLLQKALEDGVVSHVSNMYSSYYETNDPAYALPYFDGDYWPGLAEDLIKQLETEKDKDRKDKKSGKSNSKAVKNSVQKKKKGSASASLLPTAKSKTKKSKTSKTSNSGPNGKDLFVADDPLMQKLQPILEPQKDDFFVVHLYPHCSICRQLISPKAKRWWKVEKTLLDTPSAGGAPPGTPLSSSAAPVTPNGKNGNMKKAQSQSVPESHPQTPTAPTTSTAPPTTVSTTTAPNTAVPTISTAPCTPASSSAKSSTKVSTPASASKSGAKSIRDLKKTSAILERDAFCECCYNEKQGEVAKRLEPTSVFETRHLVEQTNTSSNAIASNCLLSPSKQSDPLIPCEIFDTREAFLTYCQSNHCQFDQMRRAKHSSMMVLYHLFQQDALCPESSDEEDDDDDDDSATDGKSPPAASAGTANSPGSTTAGSSAAVGNTSSTSGSSSAASAAANGSSTAAISRQIDPALLDLIVHASGCGKTVCDKNCLRMRALLRHGASCQVKISGKCQTCRRVLGLLQIHAQLCKEETKCVVPKCKEIREQLLRIKRQQQMMGERRQSMLMEGANK